MAQNKTFVGIDESGIKLLSTMGLLDYKDHRNSKDPFQINIVINSNASVEQDMIMKTIDRKDIDFKPISLYDEFHNKTFNPDEYHALITGYSVMKGSEVKYLNAPLSVLRFKFRDNFPPTLCAVLENAENALKLENDGKLRQFDHILTSPNHGSIIVPPQTYRDVRELIAYGKRPEDRILFGIRDRDQVKYVENY